MTAVLPITLAPADATTVSGSAWQSRAAGIAGSAVAGACRLVARTGAWVCAWMAIAGEPRLGAHAKRDIGLLPEQELDGVFGDRDDLLWRL
ncbi:hypothetical protein [Elioraea rosea]|uniref:hypothetical protein n=1 Tax=Elioraea rosea TaxID=2492390 RepID=UPI001181DCC1|nr:hypothetical protein [Elioraea rosea]